MEEDKKQRANKRNDTQSQTEETKRKLPMKKTPKHGDEVPTSKYFASCSNLLSSACILCFPLVSELLEDRD